MSKRLIYAEDAIDALERDEEYNKDNQIRADGVRDAIITIIGLPSAQPEIIRCRDCVYYDPPHVDDNGERREYKDMPNEAFDVLGTGLVSVEYGINVGGRCARDYNAMYSEDKRVFVGEDNYCGRAERRTDG